MRVLVTGIASKVANVVAERLLAGGHQIIGIDRRPWADAPKGVEMFEVDIRKRAAEDVFRKTRPEAVIHMATVTHLLAKSDDRYRINLGGTRAVFDYSRAHGVKQVIVVGRHTYYGAAPDSPLYHSEDEPPMAMTTFPGDGSEDDEVIAGYVDQVKARIAALIDVGRRHRSGELVLARERA